MRVLLATIMISLLFLQATNAAIIKRLSGSEAKPRLSVSEIEKLSLQESTSHAVEGYVSVKSVVDCFDEMSYNYTGGRYNNEEIKFRLRSPNNIKLHKKYPLVVWFHGKGESGDDNRRQLAHLQYTLEFLVGPKSLDFFMLVTQCPKDNPYWNTSVSQEGKGDAPVTIAMEIFEHLIEEYPIDKSMISTFGQCSGAVGSWELIKKYPELIAAVTPIVPDIATTIGELVAAGGQTEDSVQEIIKDFDIIERKEEFLNGN